MFIWNFLVWVFESGLLIGFLMLLILLAVCGCEFYPTFKKWEKEHHILHTFKQVYTPFYKQTSIIIAPTMCYLHRKNARCFLLFSYLNAFLVFLLLFHGCVAYLNLLLMILFLILAAAHTKVLGKYEQLLWEAACNHPPEKNHEKYHIKKRT